MDGEVIVEGIREDGAEVVANQVATTVAIEGSIISSEVGAVGNQLAEHAATSEERHDEILEGQEWLESQFQLMTSRQSALEAQLTAMAAQLLAMQTTIIAALETVANRSLSTGSNGLTPEPEPPNPETVNPESAASAQTQEIPVVNEKRRRVRTL